MLSRKMLSAILAAVVLTFSLCFGQDPFFIKDGDEVLVWGNSITDDGIYPRLIENYVLTHYPDWKVTFFNLGWGGDQTRNVGRLRRDIQLCKPTKVAVMLGMNDGEYKPFDQKMLEVYLQGMKDEIELMQAHSNPQVMLISATPWEFRCTPQIPAGKVDDFSEFKLLFYPQTLRRLSSELGSFADREGHKFCDLNMASQVTIDAIDEYDGNFMFTAEGVHPNIDGQLQLGLKILESMQAPSLVAELEICAKSGKVLSQQDCSVEGVSKTAAGIVFNRKAARLPLPIYPSTRKLMKEVLGYPDNWDRDMITVKNLEPGWYKLAIDGKEIDILSHSQFAQGVNLSRYAKTPQMIQAYQVFEQTEIRQDAFYAKWRRVLLGGVPRRLPSDFTPFKTDVSTDSLERVEKRAFEAQHKLNKPRAHRYEISQVQNPAQETGQKIRADKFLENMIRVSVSVDSRTLPVFEPPLCIRGNFTYSPQYRWGIIEFKRYYTDIPVVLYDDGTHGDALAGDGVWSVEMFFRKDAGRLRFIVRDGSFLKGYWNQLHPESFNNSWCESLTKAWGEIQGVSLDKDIELKWDMKMFEKALAAGKIYQP